MAGWMPHKSIEESREILDRFIAHKKTFAIAYNGKVIGSIGIEEYEETELPEPEYREKSGRELGYVLSKDYWGRGIMPEAVNAVVRYLFDDLKLDFIVCGHFTDNNQSKRVQEKCGFKHLRLIKYETAYGTEKDCWISILNRQ